MVNKDVILLRDAYFFGVYDLAAELAQLHLGISNGVAEFVLCRLCKAGELKDVQRKHQFRYAELSFNEGYWRASHEMAIAFDSVSRPGNLYTCGPFALTAGEYLQQGVCMAMEAYENCASADAAGYLGACYCGDVSSLSADSAVVDRERGLKYLYDAFDLGFQPIALYIARVLYSGIVSPTSDEWLKKYNDCRDEFIAMSKA